MGFEPKLHKAPRKQGRPSKGNALSAAARQARWQVKPEAEGKTLLPRTAISVVRQALASYIQFKDMTLGDALEHMVRDRLLRKRSGKRKSKEPTHGKRQRFNQPPYRSCSRPYPATEPVRLQDVGHRNHGGLYEAQRGAGARALGATAGLSKAIQLPTTSGGRGHARYRAKEIWA